MMLVLLFCVVISAAVAAEDVAEDRSSSEVHYGYQRHYGYHPHLSGGIFKFDLFEPYFDLKFLLFPSVRIRSKHYVPVLHIPLANINLFRPQMDFP